ncbi:MAG: flippase [Paludibacter sp.]|nr:flippase [Paludibacter sp.]
MKIKTNFIYSSILTVSNFLFPLLTFPYISRVLGVSNVGIYNWVGGIIQYFIIFSMMGIAIVGIREVAKHKGDSIELSKTFSSLLTLTLLTTVISLVILFALMAFVPKIAEYKEMFYIGAANIFVNLFLVEWFFKGIENFKYITMRSIIVKSLYVISVFVFVRHHDDYITYYLLTVSAVVLNALFNWIYSRKFVHFNFKSISLRPFIKPFLILGIYLLFNSMYSTFNVAYLGFVGGTKEVGFYTTATKLYGILLAFFSAFTGVMLPRISALVAENDFEEVNRLIGRSFDILYTFCFPIIIFFVAFAPQVISIIAGKGYEGSILPMRIVMPLMVIIGTEEILIIQLLMPMNKDKAIFINSVIGAIVGICFALILVRNYHSVGSSIVWVFSELSILISASYFVKKYIGITIPYKMVLLKFLYSIPYILICYVVLVVFNSSFVILAIGGIASFFYFILDDIYFSRNNFIKGTLLNRL